MRPTIEQAAQALRTATIDNTQNEKDLADANRVCEKLRDKTKLSRTRMDDCQRAVDEAVRDFVRNGPEVG